MNPEEIKRKKQQEGKRRNRIIIITIVLLLFVLVIAGGVTPTLFNGFFNKAPLIPVSEVTTPIAPKVNTPKDKDILIPEETQVAAIDEAEPIITPEPAKIKPKFSPLKTKPPIINPTPSIPNIIPGNITIPNTPEIPDTPEIPNTPEIPDTPEPEPETPFIPWVRGIIGVDTYDSAGGWKIASLSDGSSIAAGWLLGSAIFGEGEVNETTLIGIGPQDIVVAKYNADGGLIWAKRAGGTDLTLISDITSLSDGSSIVTGEFGETAIFGEGEVNETTLINVGGDDIFIAKYNSDGSLAWAKQAGDINNFVSPRSKAIASLSDGSSIVTGWFSNAIIFGEGELNETVLNSTGNGDKDIFIAKYNADGSLAWAKRAGGVASPDWGQAIDSFSDGSSIVTGWLQGTAIYGEGEVNETTLINIGGTDIFIAKYNADGSLAWAKRAGGADVYADTNSYSITSISDGSSIVTGSMGDIVVFGEGEANETTLTSDYAGFIAKYNADGSLAWAKRVGGVEGDIDIDEIDSFSDGSSIITGALYSISIFGEGEANETILTNIKDDDGYIAKYNVDGTLAWARQIGNTEWDDTCLPYGIAVYPDGKISITGEYEGNIVFGLGDTYETTITSITQFGMFIAKYNADGRFELVN